MRTICELLLKQRVKGADNEHRTVIVLSYPSGYARKAAKARVLSRHIGKPTARQAAGFHFPETVELEGGLSAVCLRTYTLAKDNIFISCRDEYFEDGKISNTETITYNLPK